MKNDSKENNLDDDVDIPWSIEQRNGSWMIKDRLNLNYKLQFSWI